MLLGPEKSLADEQSRMNDSTRGQWDWYANHRQHIEKLILPKNPTQTICVLGAGNCNDLDLKWLTQAYAQVHLVDIDPTALQRAAQRQNIANNPRLTLHAPIDLTGIADRTSGWRGRPVLEKEVIQAAKACAINQPPIAQTFDVVLSPCVLSQLLCGVRDLTGKDHPQWPMLKAALRARHLRQIGSLVRPGGKAVLVVDLSSTSALPGLDRAQTEDLPNLMRLALDKRKCYRGLEPAELISAIRTDPTLRTKTQKQSVADPWLWHLGWGKAFLVYALTLEDIR